MVMYHSAAYWLAKEHRTEVCANRFKTRLTWREMAPSRYTDALLSYLLHGLDGLASPW